MALKKTWAKQIEASLKNKWLCFPAAKYKALNRKNWKTIVQNFR